LCRVIGAAGGAFGGGGGHFLASPTRAPFLPGKIGKARVFAPNREKMVTKSSGCNQTTAQTRMQP